MFTVRRVVGHRVRSAEDTDAHGNPVVTYADPEPVDVYGWGPGRMSSDVEPKLAGHDRVVVDLAVYGPPALRTIVALDRVDVEDVTYEVVGEPEDYVTGNPFDWEPGVVVNLRRIAG